MLPVLRQQRILRIGSFSRSHRLQQEAVQTSQATPQRVISRSEFIANKKIAHYTKENNVEAVELVLRDMEEEDLELSRMYCNLKLPDKAMNIFKSLEADETKISYVVYQQLIMMFVKLNRPMEVEALISHMRLWGQEPNPHLLNVLIGFYGRYGNEEKAVELYEFALSQHSRIDLSKESIMQLTQIFLAQSNILKVIELFTLMKGKGSPLLVDDDYVAGIVNQLERKKATSDAQQLRDWAKENGFDLNRRRGGDQASADGQKKKIHRTTVTYYGNDNEFHQNMQNAMKKEDHRTEVQRQSKRSSPADLSWDDVFEQSRLAEEESAAKKTEE